jgi:RHS repeat-associated protein
VGNLTVIDYSSAGPPGTPSVTNSYDPLNRITNMLDGVGTTTYTYTIGGLLASEDGPFGSDMVTNFYANRLRAGLSLTQPAGAWTNGFLYDAADRLTNVISPAGTFAYYYPPGLPSSLVQELVLPNTSYIANGYDVNARLTATVLYNSANATLDSSLYGYNVGNQRVAFTNAAGTDVSYAYDPIGQLTVASSTVSSEDRGYAYDAAWNLSSRTNNGASTNFSVNDLNELTADPGTSFYYDANGNLTNASSSFATTSYTYDDENRLIGVQYQGGALLSPTLTTFVYDGLGRLREQLQWTNSSGGGGEDLSGLGPLIGGGGGSTWTLTGGTLYMCDGKRVIQERGTNNTPTVSYTRGPDLSGTMEGAGGIGGLLARSSGYYAPSGTWSTHDYYHADGNGNITYLVNSSQTLAASYRYDPYGNLISSSGSLAATNTYRFSSKEFIPSAGLYYYLYRFYDPTLQRWINRDPLMEGGGVNLYAAIGNSPPNGFDSDGRWGNFYYRANPLLPNSLSVDNTVNLTFSIVPEFQSMVIVSPPVLRAPSPIPVYVPPPQVVTVPTGQSHIETSYAGDDPFLSFPLNVASSIANNPCQPMSVYQAIEQSDMPQELKEDLETLLFMAQLGIILESDGAAEELFGAEAIAAESGTIDPALVRFSQDSISGSFKNGGTISDLVSALNGPGGADLASQIPPIRLVVGDDGLLYTLDNRRLAAFSMTDLQVPYQMATPEEISAEWASKFTTTPQQGMGQFITVRPPSGWQP